MPNEINSDIDSLISTLRQEQSNIIDVTPNPVFPATELSALLDPCNICGAQESDVYRTYARIESDPWGDLFGRNRRDRVCRTCSNALQYCGQCGRVYPEDVEMRVVGAMLFCPGCAAGIVECVDCGLEIHRDFSGYVNDEVHCLHCCNINHPPEDSDEDEDEDEDEDYRPEGVRDYGYKPYPVFHGNSKSDLYFGCELEVNWNRGCAEEAASWALQTFNDGQLDHVYLKADGSIGPGFEIVSHPHSWEEAKKLWMKLANSGPVTSHKSGDCGFHVHVSRKAITALQLRKILVFINSPGNAGLIDKVAQRSSNRFCRKFEKWMTSRLSEDRYEAINVTNPNTIEFRIFRGNTRPERIMKNLEFVHAVIHFVNTVSYRQLTSEKFKEYVDKNKKEYPNLHAFITDEPSGGDI